MSFLHVAFRPSLTCSSRLHGCYRRFSTTNSVASDAKEGKKPSESIPAATPRSSCAPDTILTGVNYLKGQPPVVSLTDDAYPEWLWDVLKPKVYEDDGPGGKKERMERRKANRQSIKDRNFMQTQ